MNTAKTPSDAESAHAAASCQKSAYCQACATSSDVVPNDVADALADALVGPVLPASPVYRAYVGEGFAEPPTRDMRGCVLLGGGA